MKVDIDYTQLTAERRRVADVSDKARDRAWVRVRQVSFETESFIKRRMPVDTGRARASWGHSSPPASPADGIWREDQGALSIVQGTTVEYVQYLNEGSSTQAPAGFIDVEEQRALQRLEQYLADDLAELF